jgi:hypothetical protein
MDRIIVLDEGEIVEMGSHRELLDNPDGTYASFWAHQSGGFLASRDGNPASGPDTVADGRTVDASAPGGR